MKNPLAAYERKARAILKTLPEGQWLASERAALDKKIDAGKVAKGLARAEKSWFRVMKRLLLVQVVYALMRGEEPADYVRLTGRFRKFPKLFAA